MSKLKEQILRQQDQQLLYMGKFLDYIYDNVVCKDLGEDELDEMERSNSIHSDVVIGSLSKQSFKSANNKDYNPNKQVEQGEEL